jgi:hypothetical protein
MLAAMLTGSLVLAQATGATATTSPLTERKDLVVSRCTACHGLDVFAEKRYSHLAWHLVVLRMQVLHGADLEPGERDTLVAQLAASAPPPLWQVAFDWSLLGAAGVAIGYSGWKRVRHRRRMHTVFAGLPRRCGGSGSDSHGKPAS